MDEHNTTPGFTDLETEAGALTRPDPTRVQQAMGPVITMEVVQRYVESERNRNRRILLWIGTLSLLILLGVLVAFVAIGIFVLNNSHTAVAKAQEAESSAAAFVADVADVSSKVKALDDGHEAIKEDLALSEQKQAKSQDVFQDNLVRFSQWVAESDNKGAEAVAALKFRLQEIETALDAREKELMSLRERYGSLVASVAASAQRQQVPPTGTAPGTPEEPDVAEDASFQAMMKGLQDMDVAKSNAVAESVTKPHVPNPGSEVTVMTFPNGERYEGSFKDGLFDGYGTYVFQNGDRYEGEFKEDRMDGQGTMRYANGNVYRGQFQHGVRHGRGTLTFANGDSYEGEFADNARHGFGTYRFTNGARYIGEFRNNLRHGKGRYEYPSGEKYVGYFKEGKMDGPGICTYANGKQVKGEWKAGKLVRRIED